MGKSEIYIFGFRGFPDVQGGVETHVENLAPQLVQHGAPRDRLCAFAVC